MILFCLVRPGDENEELRYAMRSWQQNLDLPGGLTLVTVGYKPAWLTPDHHIDGNRHSSLTANVWDNVRLASEWFVYEGEALYMNDDFFCMDPMTGVPVVKRNLTLDQHIDQSPGLENNWFGRSLDLTARWLASEGYPHPDSYEVHRPLLARPRGMVSALDRWTGGLEGDIPQWRTAYGVLNEVEAHPVVDGKLSDKVTGIGTPWLSTSDQSWPKWRRAISMRFQKPSRWES